MLTLSGALSASERLAHAESAQSPTRRDSPEAYGRQPQDGRDAGCTNMQEGDANVERLGQVDSVTRRGICRPHRSWLHH